MRDYQSPLRERLGRVSSLTNTRLISNVYKSLGHVATRGYYFVADTVNNSTVSLSPSKFIQSLTKLNKSSVDRANNLADVLSLSNQILARANTIFPLDLFPDSIVLDRAKLTVVRRTFFFTEDVMSIRIEDILNASAAVGPFFGSVTIATRVLSSNDHFTIYKLWRKDALHLKHMIQGYVIARHNNISCDHLSREEMIRTLVELGREKHQPSATSSTQPTSYP